MKCKCGVTYLAFAAAGLLGLVLFGLTAMPGCDTSTTATQEGDGAAAGAAGVASGQAKTCARCAAAGKTCTCVAKKPTCACMQKSAEAATAEATYANAVCPMMGSKIDPANVPASLTREFKDRKVAFCCAGCPVAWDRLSDEQKQAKLDAARGTE